MLFHLLRPVYADIVFHEDMIWIGMTTNRLSDIGFLEHLHVFVSIDKNEYQF